MADEPDTKPDESPDEVEVSEVEEKVETTGGPSDEERREFMAKAGSVVLGGLMVAAPIGAGVATFLSPLRQKSAGGITRRLAAVADLPNDGTPKRFDITTDRGDAWTRYPTKAVGSVWLRKRPDGSVQAFNTTCPHLGCAIDYDAKGKRFLCPCHASAFTLDGAITGKSVSPRTMDTLEVNEEKLAAGEVVVTFQEFKTGTSDKQPA